MHELGSLLAGLVSLASACATSPTTAQPSAHEHGEPAAAPSDEARGATRIPEAPDGQLSQAHVEAEALRVLEEVAAARELEITREIAVETIDHAGIREHARASMYEHMTPERMALLGRIESSLGVLPLGSDPEEVMLELLEQGVLGLYDPKKQTLFVGSFVQPLMLAMVVGHEIVHGLQDMHFDLERHSKPIWHESDRESARRFVIEGEAQAAYLAWTGRDAGLSELDDATLVALGDQALSLGAELSPYPILARSLQMPYAHGTATIARLVQDQGWTAVDELYEDLPTTTEQMLHLDKLRAREPARPVALNREALADRLAMTASWHDTLGEASLLAMLAQVERPREASAAAAGWGGDAYVALTPTDDPATVPVVIVATVWDTKKDAEEFATSFASYLDEAVGADRSFIDRRGDAVVFATRVAPERHEQVRAAAWDALSRGRDDAKSSRKRREHSETRPKS